MHHHEILFNQSSTNGSRSDGRNNNAEKKSSETVDEEFRIKFSDWGFKINRLFEVAYRFYKRNENKAFHLGFDERSKMVALIMQAKFGNFDGGKAPDIGVLDIVGKRRQYEWSLLKGMTKTEAMTKFICELNDICPIFKAHAEAVKISLGIDGEIYCNDEMGNEVKKMVGQSGDPSLFESSSQLPGIYSSLCKQTHTQFKSYAEKQHPGDIAKQKQLIASLQEQYYQQYISQLNPKLKDSAATTKQPSGVSENQTSTLITSSRKDETENQRTKSGFESHLDRQNVNRCSQEVMTGINDNKASISEPGENMKPLCEHSVQESINFRSDNISDINCEDNNVQTDISCEELNSESNLNLNEVSIADDHQLDEPPRASPTRSSGKISPSSQTSANPHNLVEVIRLGQNLDLPPIGMFESFPEPKLVQSPERVDTILDTIDPNFPHRTSQHLHEAKHLDKKVNPNNQTISDRNLLVPEESSNLSSVITSSEQNLVQQYTDTPETGQDISLNFIPAPSAHVEASHNVEKLAETEEIADRMDANNVEAQSIVLQEATSDQQEAQQPELWGRASSSDGCSPELHTTIAYQPPEPAIIWTKRAVSEFRDSLGGDKQAGVYEIKEGALIVIQVPTYPDGKYIYWEFATDGYDIGFGLDFVHSEHLIEPLALNIYQDNDDDDELEDIIDVDNWQGAANTLHDPEYCRSGLVNDRDRLLAERRQRLANTVPILPTYRRDSHEEVFVGRHKYPGRGYYLLKFDNTYSVLRSKTLYFRICYFM